MGPALGAAEPDDPPVSSAQKYPAWRTREYLDMGGLKGTMMGFVSEQVPVELLADFMYFNELGPSRTNTDLDLYRG